MKCRMDLNPENVQNIGTKSREVPSHRKFLTIIFVVVETPSNKPFSIDNPRRGWCPRTG